MSIADLRTVYRRATLDEGDVASDPIAQCRTWLDQAIEAGVLEPTAMTLATVGEHDLPAARIVLLKGIDVDGPAPGASGRGFVWFTNYDSRKGDDLALHPHAALCFFWPELERQVRIEGRVEKVAPDESDRYFASRPMPSRVGAWASPQSRAIPSRATIEDSEAEVRTRFALDGDDERPIARPPHWGGYRLVPTAIEFWQGRPSRLHDRLAFRGGDGAWTITRLAP